MPAWLLAHWAGTGRGATLGAAGCDGARHCETQGLVGTAGNGFHIVFVDYL